MNKVEVKSKLWFFIQKEKIKQTLLFNEYIEKPLLKKDTLPLSWKSLSQIINGHRTPTLEFMTQIRNGVSLYLNRNVTMDEIFELDKQL